MLQIIVGVLGNMSVPEWVFVILYGTHMMLDAKTTFSVRRQNRMMNRRLHVLESDLGILGIRLDKLERKDK